MEYVTIVAMLALIQLIVFSMIVGKARGAAGIKAPAMTGDEVFERTNRAHQNSLEQIVIFIPALYAAAYYLYPELAAGFGVMYVIGRTLYFQAYVKEPSKRGPGMMFTMFANMALIIAAIVGAMIAL